MGRGKPPMELIASERQRKLTFKKRKDGLFKKVQELTTLCGVKACAVIYGPNSSSKAETWPPQDGSDTVLRQLFDVYKARKRDLGHVRTLGVSDFFQERKKKAEDELHSLRNKNRESLDSYDENQLRQFGAMLKDKIDRAAWKIEQLKEKERLSYPVNHQDPMMMMMMAMMKNNNYEIPPHHDRQLSNITKNNNEIPPHHHQIGYTNYGQQQGCPQLDLVLSDHQNQQKGCVHMQHHIRPQFRPQIDPYARLQSMPMNVSAPQSQYLQQDQLVSNNMELHAGWDLESGNGGLEDIVAAFRTRRR